MKQIGRRVDHPIIVLGAARSGTTLLAETVLSKHPQIVYWNEPSHIWKAEFSYRSEDVIGAHEVSDGYCNFVRSAFATRMVDAPPDARFMEKTPSNCLRIPAVLKVFPDAQFIHVIRDGRAVALSASHEWSGRKTDALDSSDLRRQGVLRRLLTTFRREAEFAGRLRHWRTTVTLPAYGLRFVQAVLRQTIHTTRIPWGPRVPGLAAFRRSHSLIETCAYQWEQCTRFACNAGRRLSATQYFEVKFEDLISDPVAHLQSVAEFLGIEPYSSEQLATLATQIGNRGKNWRQRYAPKDLLRVERQIGVYLTELGYECGFDSA